MQYDALDNDNSQSVQAILDLTDIVIEECRTYCRYLEGLDFSYPVENGPPLPTQPEIWFPPSENLGFSLNTWDELCRHCEQALVPCHTESAMQINGNRLFIVALQILK